MAHHAANNAAIVPVRFSDWSTLSDGDSSNRPMTAAYVLSDVAGPDCSWGLILAREVVARTPELDDGTVYDLIELPQDYTLYYRDRRTALTPTVRRDFQIYGHPGPGPSYYRSAATFAVHLVWLLDPTRADCQCVICRRNAVAERVPPTQRAPGGAWGFRDVPASSTAPDLGADVSADQPMPGAEDSEGGEPSRSEEPRQEETAVEEAVEGEGEEEEDLSMIDPRLLAEDERAARERMRIRNILNDD